MINFSFVLDVAAAGLPQPDITVEGYYKSVLIELNPATIIHSSRYSIFFCPIKPGQACRYDVVPVTLPPLKYSLDKLEHLQSYKIFVKGQLSEEQRDSNVVVISTTGKS